MVIYYWLVAESPSIPDSAILIRKKPPQTRELAGLSFGRTMVMPSTLFAGLSWIRNTRIPESGISRNGEKQEDCFVWLCVSTLFVDDCTMYDIEQREWPFLKMSNGTWCFPIHVSRSRCCVNNIYGETHQNIHTPLSLFPQRYKIPLTLSESFLNF
jgi:hypothetical protein